MKKFDLKLYLVTDRTWLKSHQTLSDAVAYAIKGGATLVQIREKDLSDEEYISEALELKKICQSYSIPLIINDRVDIAKIIDADGVHLGQEDGLISEARKILGEDKIIGATAHNLDEALNAEKSGADYLGVGAVFGSTTKSNTTPLTYETLKNICSSVKIPVCAIGGIDIDNISNLADSRINGVAVISAILKGDDITKSAKQMKEKAEIICRPKTNNLLY